jgi:HPt (histidine-containing phosphotransfer) domain-containing protein
VTRALDGDRLMKSLADPDLVRTVIDLFLADAPVRVAQMAQALAERDPARLGAAAHAMKGAALSLCLGELVELCAAIERAAREPSFVSLEEIARLHAAHERARAALSNLRTNLGAPVDASRAETEE